MSAQLPGGGTAGSGGRPIVAVTAYEERARWGDWDLPAALLPASYVRAVERAGAVPLIVPVQELEPEDARRIVARVDGLILAGGPDVDPARYGDDRHPETTEATEGRLRRDAVEVALVEALSATPTPTLGICRGVQVLNVARGGGLVQHLPDVSEGSHGGVPGGFGSHEVRLQPGSLLAQSVGKEVVDVQTRHHQAIDGFRLGKGLEAVAWADDGTVEALEDRSLPFLVGVQWHPEAGEDPSLLAAFVEAARGAMLARRAG